jgi:hypothetical protein
VLVEGVKGVKYTPKAHGMYENSETQAVFPLIDLKITKNAILLKSIKQDILPRLF